KELSTAVDKGYIFKGVDYDTPDYIAREVLKQNVWKFSVAKNYNDCIRLNNLLLRPDGSIRPWNEFKREAMTIVGMSNRYLKTEYDTIVAGAMMSRKWQEIQRDKYIFPFVKFMVTMDDHTSEICSPLHGIVVSVDDPFLQQYFPPNHFNCRTDVIKLRNAEPTPQRLLPYIDIPKAFLNNVGATGEIFTEENRYIANTPDEVLEKSNDLHKAEFKERLKQQRLEIRDWAKNNIVGTTITHKNIDGDILFTVRGIKEALNQPHKHILAKNNAIKDIVNLIKKAEFVKTGIDSKGRDIKYYYLKTIIQDEDSFIVIKEEENRLTFYTITDKIKE
ncbi:minor capsid protein, partial [Riemerella anatipestifer]|uniref:LPD3 domain-containing protein n=1 Tax=Riemerella anatipestifer TaxID=34085 RepID=UPI002EA69EDB|nr:minor capsid protein [Riemerella anatipestifer]